MKTAAFCPGSLRPATDRFIKRVGANRNELHGATVIEMSADPEVKQAQLEKTGV